MCCVGDKVDEKSCDFLGCKVSVRCSKWAISLNVILIVVD